MFQQGDTGAIDSAAGDPGGSACAAARLSPGLVAATTAHGAWFRKLARLRCALSRLDWSAIDWAPDLAEEIGSRRWLRGVATFFGLLLVALALLPGFELKAAPAMQTDNPVRDEFRSQMIMPLGLGGDSGRRMAASNKVRPASIASERSQVQLTAVFTAGDSFAGMLQRAGVAPQDAAQASELVASQVPLGQLQPGTQIALVLGDRSAPDQPRGLQSLDFKARLDLSLEVKRSGSELAVTAQTLAIDTSPLRIRGLVGPSLYRSARAAGAPAAALQQYLQALDSHISLEGDIQPGDTFDLILSPRRASSGTGLSGEVLYASLNRGDTPVVELMRWGSSGQLLSADAITRPVTQTSTVSTGGFLPVSGRITSGFGFRRHPILGYARMHAGVDIGAGWGSPIHATAAGLVSFAGRHGGHGNYVRLDHGGGLGTGYGHMSRIAVFPGERINAGQVIGYVGSTGLSTGPHLHYEMYRSGRTVNPVGGAYAATTSTVVQQIDPQQIAAFKARLAKLKAIRSGASPGAMAMARPSRVALR